MPRLNDKQREKLIADYHAGLNKNRLSIKYDVAPSAVAKIVEGIIPKNIEKVNTLIDVALGLQDQTEQELLSINQQVAQKVGDFEFFRSASLVIARKAVAKVKKEDLSMADLEKAQMVIGKGKENIYGRLPETAVQINNNAPEMEKFERPQVDKEEWLKLHGVGGC